MVERTMLRKLLSGQIFWRAGRTCLYTYHGNGHYTSVRTGRCYYCGGDFAVLV